MPRQLQPCGTYGAYQRHLRHKEPVDDACRAAGRAQRAARNPPRHAKRGEQGRIPDGELNELAEARENLVMVKTAMKASPSSGMAALSKQYMELVALIKRLERAGKPGVSVLDQLGARRDARIAAAQAAAAADAGRVAASAD